MSVIVYTSAIELSPEQVTAVAMHPIAECWSQSPLQTPFQWSLVRDPQWLWFTAAVPAVPALTDSVAVGDFVEGLWESDVAEFFLMAPDGRYEEFNLSSAGAWWAMSFAAYRSREQNPTRAEGVRVVVDRGKVQWRGTLGIPIGSLPTWYDEQTRVHVAGILYGATGTHYLSSNPQFGTTPDFHNERCFQRQVFVALEG